MGKSSLFHTPLRNTHGWYWLTDLAILFNMNIIEIILDWFQGRTLGARRSSDWSRIRRAHLEVENKCQICGKTKGLEVHHIVPFHVEPGWELRPSNLITLCGWKKNGCHRRFGHLFNYRKCNLDIREDSKLWKNRLGIKGA